MRPAPPSGAGSSGPVADPALPAVPGAVPAPRRSRALPAPLHRRLPACLDDRAQSGGRQRPRSRRSFRAEPPNRGDTVKALTIRPHLGVLTVAELAQLENQARTLQNRNAGTESLAAAIAAIVLEAI